MKIIYANVFLHISIQTAYNNIICFYKKYIKQYEIY